MFFNAGLFTDNIFMLFYLAIINIVTFLVYGLDKWKARNDQWRIPERTLLFLAFIGGGAGAWAGMEYFRHKTRHTSFRIIVPLCTILWAIWLIVRLFGINVYR